MQLKLLEIARATRTKGGQSQEKLKSAYSKLLHATSRVVGQAKRFAEEIAAGVKQPRSLLKQMALTLGGGKVPDAKTIGRWGMAR